MLRGKWDSHATSGERYSVRWGTGGAAKKDEVVVKEARNGCDDDCREVPDRDGVQRDVVVVVRSRTLLESM